MKIKTFFVHILVIIFSFSSFQGYSKTRLPGEIQLKKKEFIHSLSFNELVTLSQIKDIEDPLKGKLSRILYNPVIDNTIADPNAKLNKDMVLGDFIRIGSWNIARGLHFETIKMIFEDPEELLLKIRNKKEKFDKDEFREIQKQLEILRNTDIFLLNEVDIGMPRTKYRNVAEELAKILGFNYAFGVEFVEVDPTHLGMEDHEWSEENILFPNKDYVVDKERYKGFHGNAVLSRYPLSNVRIIRLPDYYGWDTTEKNKIANLEVARRKAADFIFGENVLREIRIGSRIALVADVDVPGLEEPLTVISVHLENRVVPEYRYKQVKYLLDKIKHIKNPVVLAGDFNTTTKDGRPTTISREIRKRITDLDYLAKHVIYLAIPYTYIVNGANLATNILRTHNNPTVMNIPVISPNEERKLFNTIEDMEFADGGKFDFSGEKYRSVKDKWGMLANSNQRSLKGFVPTFMFNRDWVIGQFKLDWIFVKPCVACEPVRNEEEEEDLRKLKPYFGRTLIKLNHSLYPPISDHAPITVDLPLDPPNEKETEKIIHRLEKIKEKKTVPLPD